MTKRKELGAVHYSRCTGCHDELAVGWLGDRPVPYLADGARRATYAPDRQGMVLGPVACGCGATRIQLHPEAPGRVILEWTTPEEPVVASQGVHGSLRDMVGKP